MKSNSLGCHSFINILNDKFHLELDLYFQIFVNRLHVTLYFQNKSLWISIYHIEGTVEDNWCLFHEVHVF